jgi:hypothetical protein
LLDHAISLQSIENLPALLNCEMEQPRRLLNREGQSRHFPELGRNSRPQRARRVCPCSSFSPAMTLT